MDEEEVQDDDLKIDDDAIPEGIPDFPLDEEGPEDPEDSYH